MSLPHHCIQPAFFLGVINISPLNSGTQNKYKSIQYLGTMETHDKPTFEILLFKSQLAVGAVAAGERSPLRTLHAGRVIGVEVPRLVRALQRTLRHVQPLCDLMRRALNKKRQQRS